MLNYQRVKNKNYWRGCVPIDIGAPTKIRKSLLKWWQNLIFRSFRVLLYSMNMGMEFSSINMENGNAHQQKSRLGTKMETAKHWFFQTFSAVEETKKKLNPVKPSRFHGHFRRTHLSLRQEKNMLSMMPSNEVYCSHSKRLAPTHLVTNLIDFQATTSFEVLQAMRRVISLTYQPWPGTLESELEAPHFCRGRRQRHESCHTGKPDFRVSNWAPRKARTQPKCEFNGWILLKNQIDTFWLPGNWLTILRDSNSWVQWTIIWFWFPMDRIGSPTWNPDWEMVRLSRAFPTALAWIYVVCVMQRNVTKRHGMSRSVV